MLNDGCAPCAEIGSSAYWRDFMERARTARVPLSGAFDLTYRCNLRCVHCYAGHLTAQKAAQAGELSTRQVLRLLSEATAAGCLNLLLSGGEPLLRPDFVETYSAARRAGLLVTVFTNATLINESHLAAFAEYPPYLVDVSVYGASEETYERVTRVPGSFGLAMRGIGRILDRGIRLGLKTMILRENAAELDAIERFASDLGVDFRVDPLVVPRIDGGTIPLLQRLEAAEAVALEVGSERRQREMAKVVERALKVASPSRPYSCGAGSSGFHIDPQGALRPCLMSRDLAFDAHGVGFERAWQKVVESVDAIEFEPGSVCAACALASLCGFCPGLFALETGSPSVPPEYCCILGKRRAETVALSASSRFRSDGGLG